MRTLRIGTYATAERSGGDPSLGFAISRNLIKGATVRFISAQVPSDIPTVGTAAVHDRITPATLRALIAQDGSQEATFRSPAAQDVITTASVGSTGATVRITAATGLSAVSPDGNAVSSIGSGGNPVGVGPSLTEVTPLPTVLPAIKLWEPSFPSVMRLLTTGTPAFPSDSGDARGNGRHFQRFCRHSCRWRHRSRPRHRHFPGGIRHGSAGLPVRNPVTGVRTPERVSAGRAATPSVPARILTPLLVC